MADQPQWMEALFAAIDAKDTKTFLTFLSEDAVFRFGNAEPISGRAAIGTAVDAFFASIHSSNHALANAWSAPEASVCHGTVTYRRHDHSYVTVPFANALYIDSDGKINQYLIHIDLAPLAVTQAG